MAGLVKPEADAALSADVIRGSRDGDKRATDAALSALLPAFSYPQPSYVAPLDELVPLIVREYAAGLTGSYLVHALDRVEAASEGLTAYIASWVADPSGTLNCRVPVPGAGWDYAFGDAYRTMLNAGGDPVGVTAGIAMHLGARGVPGSWRVEPDGQLRLRWDNWLLPAAERIAVETDGERAHIRYSGSAGSGTVSLAVVDGRWRADGAAKMTSVARHGIAFDVLTRDALAMRDYEELLGRTLTTVDARMMDVFSAALDIVAAHTPQYLRWIARTVHQLFLIAPRPGKVESGSVEHYLGLVHLTEHPEPLPVAELLVHEATHQYMNVIAKLEPLDDGSDQRAYWSPAVRTERPVAKIIAAFHAFGNVLLFYRWCRENGLSARGECERQETLLGGWMEHLIPPIVDNPALSETGNALCQPLLAALEHP